MRDINFTTDGTRFISVGYDRVMRLWDTETGQVRRARAPHASVRSGAAGRGRFRVAPYAALYPAAVW